MRDRVTGYHMTLPAELVAWLPQQAVIGAPMRAVAFNTSASFNRPGVGGVMLEQERSALGRMTVLAKTAQAVSQVVPLAPCHPVTGHAAEASRLNGVGTVSGKLIGCLSMAVKTEHTVVIFKKGPVFLMNCVAIAAIELES